MDRAANGERTHRLRSEFIPFGSATPELAPAWMGSGTGLWPVGPDEHGRDARATEERRRHGWLGFNASGLAPGIFTTLISVYSVCSVVLC